MESSFERGQENRGEELTQKLDDILSKKRFFKALDSKVYESAKAEYDALRVINEWRKKSKDSQAKDFYRLFEEFTELKSEKLSEKDSKTLTGQLADRLSSGARRLSPRSHDLYQAVLSSIEGKEYEPTFDLTKEKIQELTESGDLDYLINPKVEAKSKLEYLGKRFDDYISGASMLDTHEREEAEGQKEKGSRDEDNTAPEASDESKPSMDEMNRVEGNEKVPPIWIISPAWGGYYKEQSFDKWDPARKVWTKSDYIYEPFFPEARSGPEEGDITIEAALHNGRLTRLPIPYTHEVVGVGGIKQEEYNLVQDNNGDLAIKVDLKKKSILNVFAGSHTTVPIKLFLSKKLPERKQKAERPMAQKTSEQFTEETEKALEEIKKTKSGNLLRALALSRYTLSHLKYSNDSSYNSVYDNDTKGYGHSIDVNKQADCDVGNTYFALLCQKLNIPVRHVVGHMVKGKDENGNSAMTSGTGHGWSEIWDDQEKSWIRVDATPHGDPLLEEEKEEGSSEHVPGDYGEQEAVGPTDEELEKLEEKLAKVVEELSYTEAERTLAEEAGIELKEARDIVREINEAENTRLKNGRKVTDALSQLFDMIVDSRKSFKQEYSGPLKKREGGEQITNIVEHYIGTTANESDPRSREKEKRYDLIEKLISGFDVHIIGDKSGSMTQTIEGESKWKTQRRAEYLILSALHRFEEKLERSGVQSLEDKSLDVRTGAISFRGSDIKDIDSDKSLGKKFLSKDKVALWHSLTNQGSGNGDVTALQVVHQQIEKEIKEVEASGKKDNRLRIVISMTDGYPDSETGVHQMAEKLGKLGTVVLGVGLTETAKAVKQIYNTPYSHGDYVESINDLPILVAKYVIAECMRLFPEKARDQNQATLNALIASFSL